MNQVQDPNLSSVQKDDLQLINPVTKERYQNPVITKSCQHPKFCFELQDALNGIAQYGFYKCPNCKQNANNTAYNQYDLIQDWRVQAYKEFNQHTADITVIKGLMFHKYTRNKSRYLNYLDNQFVQDQIFEMFSRTSQDSSINALIKKDLNNNSNQNKKIQFWSFCLQDRVKITIPVRIIGCKHYECYELTSLLFYQHQNKKKKQFLECTQPGCSSKLKITYKDQPIQQQNQSDNNQAQTQIQTPTEEQEQILDIKALFSCICVDLDLLNAIKRSHPSSYKYYFNTNTQQIEEDVNIIDGRIVDPFINKYYETQNVNNKFNNYFEFQNFVQQQAIMISQGDLLQEDQQLAKKIALHKYRNYKVQMKDKYTQLSIEYPVRCKFCTDLSICLDMRTYIADFLYQKKQFPTKYYTCPLCGSEQKVQMLKASISNYIYLDSNMLSYMFKDMSYSTGTQIFDYQGEQYMLQEFMDRQKITRQKYIATLSVRTVEFKQIKCIIDNNQKLKYPLVIQNCGKKSIVDFSSFYKKLQNINFDIENNDFTLCKCDYCNQHPIKNFSGNIYFHEAFYEALNKFYKQPNLQNQESFNYYFADKEEESTIVQEKTSNNSKIKIIHPPKQGDTSNLQKVQGEEGFVDLMNDEEYQKFFCKKDIGGFAYKAENMKQVIGVLEFKYEKDGIHANVDEALEKLNTNANDQLKKFGFQVQAMTVKLTNDVVNQNRGEFTAQKRQ